MPAYNLPGYWTPGQAANYVSGGEYAANLGGSSYENQLRAMGLGHPSTAITTPGILTGAPGQAGAGSQGGVPTVPSPQTTQTQAIGGNLGLGQDLTALAQQVAGANAAGAAVPFNLNLPYYGENWAQAALNTNQLLQGQLPSADVQALANSVIAQRGLIGGLPADSPAVRSALARTVLGSEYAAQQQGLQNQLSMMAATPTGPAFDASTMLVTPAQQQEWQYLANVLAQSPNPDAAAWANLASLGGGIGAGYGRGPQTGGTAADQLAAESRRNEQQLALARILAGGRQGTSAPTVAPTVPVSPAYGGLSADESWMYSLGYDPNTGEELWPSYFYGGYGAPTEDYYAYSPEESQYFPGPY